LGFEKSQRSVTHDSLRYINILTYLLTYLLNVSFLVNAVLKLHTHFHKRSLLYFAMAIVSHFMCSLVAFDC